MYDISNDDMLYVPTFVGVRWTGSATTRWRNPDRPGGHHSPTITGCSENGGYQRDSRRLRGFEKLMEYEISHFTYSPKARSRGLDTGPAGTFARSICCRARRCGESRSALMDDRLRVAFRYPAMTRVEPVVVRRAGSRRVAWRSRCCFRRAVNRCSAGRLRRCALPERYRETGHVRAPAARCRHLTVKGPDR